MKFVLLKMGYNNIVNKIIMIIKIWRGMLGSYVGIVWCRYIIKFSIYCW